MFRYVYIFLTAIFFIGLAGCSGSEKLEQEEVQLPNDEMTIVAIINDEKIHNSEFQELVEHRKRMYEEDGLDTEEPHFIRQIEEQILEDLISKVLLLQAAERDGINDAYIEEHMNEIRENYADEAEFLEELKANQLTEKDLEEMLKIDLFVERYLEGLEVSEDEIDELLQQYNGFTEGEIDLEQVRPTIEANVIQKRRGELLNELLADLKAESEIQILQ
ncbi:SurA N-terminal domain-containing protein [Alkalihalobacillus sp. MEB203]|uniref:SurA N-terminal domain-containing protein n=1 Tax=Alkalihalobacterium chitinilyticum TaxID=2980103 RepID=A0ABT5VG16_9BACI|nr:SurA N-terminal domain-containing protein [Alkalihalobacterium chitinilyticum]MDE5413383.1 SurA N-terminal domain-containing protein [Alkalihalobacterium chitinilyticum]